MVKGAVPPETLGSRPGSVVTSCDWEFRGVTHNWPSVVRFREASSGLGRCWPVGISLSHRAPATLVAGGARCTVFPPTHWCGWLPGRMRAVLRSSAAWLGCVSEDA